jgi:hypothetical protein
MKTKIPVGTIDAVLQEIQLGGPALAAAAKPAPGARATP